MRRRLRMVSYENLLDPEDTKTLDPKDTKTFWIQSYDIGGRLPPKISAKAESPNAASARMRQSQVHTARA